MRAQALARERLAVGREPVGGQHHLDLAVKQRAPTTSQIGSGPPALGPPNRAAAPGRRRDRAGCLRRSRLRVARTDSTMSVSSSPRSASSSPGAGHPALTVAVHGLSGSSGLGAGTDSRAPRRLAKGSASRRATAGQHDRRLTIGRELLELRRRIERVDHDQAHSVVERVGGDHSSQPSFGTQSGCRACQKYTPGRVSSTSSSYAAVDGDRSPPWLLPDAHVVDQHPP